MDALKFDESMLESRVISVEDHYIFNLCASLYQLFFYISRLNSGDTEPDTKNLEGYFNRFPFLRSYYSQVCSYMPKGLSWSEGETWWQNKIHRQELHSASAFPLAVFNSSISFSTRKALILIGLGEEDSRFGTVFADLQQPLSYRRPMLETLGYIISGREFEKDSSPWSVCSPLLELGLVEAENTQMPRSEWVLKIAQGVWDLLRGQTTIDKIDFGPNFLSQRKNWQYIHRDKLSDIDDLILESEFHSRVRGVPPVFESAQAKILIVRASPGSHCTEVLGAIAKKLKRNLLCVNISQEQSSSGPLRIEIPRFFGAVCTILNVIPAFCIDPGPGETVELPELNGYSGPIAMITGQEGGISGIESEQLISLNMPALNPDLRLQMWQQALEGWKVEKPYQLATQFRLPGKFIRQIAGMAKVNATLEERDCISLSDVQFASRNLNRQLLDSLADHLDAKGSWSHLVAVDTTTEKLIELQQRCRYREQLNAQLGQAFNNSSNCGVRALFTGKSGTGKTLAAKILAAELGMDVYRVDLASIVNKYIGETEKNLHKVLTRAEALDVILLLDEGDALLGARTDVKNANDRYANLETNYLLQRLEHYQGIVLVTTNLSDNIDKAFQRRMDIVIPFFQPQMEQRMQIYNLHLPQDNEVDTVFLERAANFCILTGGQIRNVCLHAALLAVEEKRALNESHLGLALSSEYRKNGGTFPLDDQQNWRAPDGGMNTFASALANHRGAVKRA